MLIPRLVHSGSPSQHGRKATSHREDYELLPFLGDQLRLCLAIGTPGLFDTLHSEDQESSSPPLGPRELEFTMKCTGVNFRDVFVALGQLPDQNLDLGEYSGLVATVGEELTQKYRIGDRICAYELKTCANVLRVHESHCLLIPDDMSFEVATSLTIVWLTAYYALSIFARLQSDETILRHSGAGGVGQAAIMLARYIGAKVFVTVGKVPRKKFLMDEFSIPEDHIFPSRDLSFVDSVRRLTSGNGVDVVLNSLAGESTNLSEFLFSTLWKTDRFLK